MSFQIKTLTVKNFMSVGNATQAVNFDRKDLTLVLGENLDLGGDDSGARNGTGKTTIVNALSYALYGNALTNIRKDNLINKTNAKNMLVTIDFEKDGVQYKIERGRKPAVMKFYVGGVEQKEDENNDVAQGDNRETQADIERMLGMSHDMFKHIVALNTYTEPFLSLKSNEQRVIIEQLLGITLLSEKAESLKEQIRVTREEIQQEEFRIKAVGDANKRIQEQIESLKRRQRIWLEKKEQDLDKLLASYDELSTIDIEAELAAHKDLALHSKKSRDLADLNKQLKRAELDLDRDNKTLSKLLVDISSLENHTCHSCGQSFHDSKQQELLAQKQKQAADLKVSIAALAAQAADIKQQINDHGTLGAAPRVFYDNESDAFEHRSSMASILQQLTNKQAEQDPYGEQIEEMTSKGLEEISFDRINALTSVRDHQEFLLKLLTNKDSFIRKSIIDQNLSYLNARLGQYLDRMGLPHTVKFNNDLSVSIEELGRELDFDNLSRGERNRLILSLSWSFRDVWESLYQSINLLFIDELIDNGLDSSGVENALAILKKMSRDSDKSVWLVSHKDELTSRVHNTLKVVKENGYTTYDTSIEIT